MLGTRPVNTGACVDGRPTKECLYTTRWRAFNRALKVLITFGCWDRYSVCLSVSCLHYGGTAKWQTFGSLFIHLNATITVYSSLFIPTSTRPGTCSILYQKTAKIFIGAPRREHIILMSSPGSSSFMLFHHRLAMVPLNRCSVAPYSETV